MHRFLFLLLGVFSLMAPAFLFATETELLRAAKKGDTEALREALGVLGGGEASSSAASSRLIGLDDEDDFGRSPLHVAARYGHAEAVRLLLEAGADPKAKDSLGRTPLHAAAQQPEAEVVAVLSEHSDIHAVDLIGMTPLYYAAERGYETPVRILIEQGAQIIWGEGASTTALHYAYEGGHLEVARLLRESRAFRVDDFLTSKKDHWITLLGEVAAWGDVLMMAVLLGDGTRASLLGAEKWAHLVLRAICGGSEEMVRRLLAVAPLNLRHKRVLITQAVLRNCPHGLRALLDEEGIKVDAVDRECMSALQHAARYGYTDILEVLVEYHARLDPMALRFAIEGGHVAFVRRLLEAGADRYESLEYCNSTAIDYTRYLINHRRNDASDPLESYKVILDLLLEEESSTGTVEAAVEFPFEAVGASMSSSIGLSWGSRANRF